MALPSPHHGFDGFPDDIRADVFVREFPAAVAPANRKNLETKPPLFVLRVPGDAAAYERGVHRVVEALRRAIHQDGPLVPYAHVSATQASALLTESAGLAVQAPEHMTPDRYPHFHVVREMVAYIREHPERWPGARARELREFVCDRQKAERRGLLGALPVNGPPPDGVKLWLLGMVWHWLTWTLPRRLWAAWTSRKVMRAWLGGLPVAAGGGNLFRVMDDGVAAVQAARLVHNPLHEEALQELDGLLTRALLEDLRTPAVGGIVPKRRRRTARPVLLVELPPAGQEGAEAAGRFLRSLYGMRDTAREPGPLVVAVGQPSPELLADLGDPPESNFTQAGLHLGQKDGPPVVLVTFTEAALAGPGLPIAQVEPRRFRLSWRTTTSFAAVLTALALLGGAVAAVGAGDGENRACAGGDGSVTEPARTTFPDMTAQVWYDAARAAIDDENARAERFAAEGRTVRTVVSFGSSRPKDERDALFDGTIAELRGIALWQRRLNDEAESDDSRVPLRVEVRTTGEGFEDAERAAVRLVDETRGEDGAGRPEYEKVVGVLGYAQSREETRAALAVLGRAGIPAVGTTATADEMAVGEAGRTYWPFAPFNSTEAGIQARFASRENIVARPASQGGCVPAERAVVIESSADLYSRSLASRFRQEFPGPAKVLDFSQERDFGRSPAGAVSVSSATELATEVCRELQAEPEAVVYWSARVRDLIAFLNAVHRQSTCTSRDMTVLGGVELTNVAMTGVLGDKDWLRMYYTEYRVPVTDPRASTGTREFADAYAAFVRRTTGADDPWRQDGYSAVAYDAFHVLSEAVDEAWLPDEAVKRESVLIALNGGISFDGATGSVSYSKGRKAPPEDRTLVLSRQSARRPEVVLVCGTYGPEAPAGEQRAPCTP